MRDIVDDIIQRIESLIDFNSKTTDLYDSQYCSKEDEDCSIQYPHFIMYLVQLNRPLVNGCGFKSHCLSIKECFYKLLGCLQS